MNCKFVDFVLAFEEIVTYSPIKNPVPSKPFNVTVFSWFVRAVESASLLSFKPTLLPLDTTGLGKNTFPDPSAFGLYQPF